ncbi:MAG: hypothetical protein ACQUHE_12130 [Bacteroidia bacterium]
MRKMIFLLATSLIVACQGSQKPQSTESSTIAYTAKKTLATQKPAIQTAPSTIEQIKDVYAKTIIKLNDKRLDSLTLNYNCRQEKLGNITYYSDNGKTVLIKHVYAEYDHHEAVDQYFMLADKLYFTYFKRLNWSFDGNMGIEGATKDKITESRSYFIGGQLVYCLEKKYTIYSTSLDKVLPERIPNRSIECAEEKKVMTTLTKLIEYKNHGNGGCFE